MTSSADLTELIRQQTRDHGPVPFAWFMEQALYHPQFGYYSSGRCVIGREGDYFTSVSVGPLFGRLLAAQFLEMWEDLGRPDNFTLVEQGAHHGEFAADVLRAAQNGSPEFFASLRYVIIEPFPVLRERQSKTVAEFSGQLRWAESMSELTPFTGVYFSNELLDAFPVHVLVAGERQKEFNERVVSLEGDDFVFVEQPVSDPRLRALAERFPPLEAGHVLELNLAALDWIGSVAGKLERGYVMASDYGYARDEISMPERADGSLQCRSQHRLLDSPFEKIGCADITARVDWTSLAEDAESNGLIVSGFTDQHHFLTGLISELGDSALPDRKDQRALQTLLHPEMLGRSFQVLALAKNIVPAKTLRGFKFAREPRAVLGLTN